MNTNSALIYKFYQSFAQGNAEEMIKCYHDDITFKDPAFGRLEGDRAKQMWSMLLSRANGDLYIKYSNVVANDDRGAAKWIATYPYGPNKRRVVNHINAKFEFKDGKIINHVDDFSMWKWSKQALGISGLILGWTPYLQNKVQATTNSLLDNFIKEN